MEKGIIGIACVLIMMTISCVGCLPVFGENTSNDNSMSGVSPLTGTGVHVSGENGFDYYYQNCSNVGGNIYGLYINNLQVYGSDSAYHLILDKAYQTGIRVKIGGSWTNLRFSSDQYSSCSSATTNYPNGSVARANYFVFSNTHYYLKYTAVFYTGQPGNGYVRFYNGIYYYAGDQTITDAEVWWKLEWKVSGTNLVAYAKAPGGSYSLISTGTYASTPDTWEKEKFEDGSGHTAEIDWVSKYTSSAVHKLAAFQYPYSTSYYDHDSNAGGTLSHPVGTECLYQSNMADYYTYKTQANWHIYGW